MTPFLNLARRTARGSHGHQQYLVSAIITMGSRVLSIGINKNKTHSIMGNLKHLHAEADAILKIRDKYRLIGADIFVTRSNPNGRIGMARPCPICMKIIREHKIKSITYTDKNGDLKYEEVGYQ